MGEKPALKFFETFCLKIRVFSEASFLSRNTETVLKTQYPRVGMRVLLSQFPRTFSFLFQFRRGEDGCDFLGGEYGT